MKRILLYRFDRQPAEGLVRPDSYLRTESLEFMTSSGDVQAVPYADVKAICFFSEPAGADLFTANNSFERRPKSSGLWVRFLIRDGDQLEGLLPHNLAEWPTSGFLLTPPRAGSTRQRVFLPRAAVLSTELLGVIGAGPHTRKPRQPVPGIGQLKMFDQ